MSSLLTYYHYMKKIGFIIFLLLMLLFFLLFPSEALQASRNGLILWFEQLLPTLLPFSVLSYLVLQSGIFIRHKKQRAKKISGCEWYVILCGFLFGFPIGSKLTADLYEHRQISKTNATLLCCFTNNLSPVYVTAAIQEMLSLPGTWELYLLIYGIPFLTGIFLLLRYGRPAGIQKNTASGFHMNMQIVDTGILKGFETLIKICGYIMLFSIVAGMLQLLPAENAFAKVFLIGCAEVTNGISALSAYSCSAELKYLLAVLFLSLNGLSGLFQTASILSSTDLSMKNYIKLKGLLVLITTGSAGLLFLRGRLL